MGSSNTHSKIIIDAEIVNERAIVPARSRSDPPRPSEAPDTDPSPSIFSLAAQFLDDLAEPVSAVSPNAARHLTDGATVARASERATKSGHKVVVEVARKGQQIATKYPHLVSTSGHDRPITPRK